MFSRSLHFVSDYTDKRNYLKYNLSECLPYFNILTIVCGLSLTKISSILKIDNISDRTH